MTAHCDDDDTQVCRRISEVVNFVLVPDKSTLRRIATSRRRSSWSIRHQLASRARTASWIVFIIFCATRSTAVMSAPIHRGSSHHNEEADPPSPTEPEAAAALPSSSTTTTERLREVRPKWVNPCGGVMDDAAADAAAGPPLSDAEVASSAMLDVEMALHHVLQFKNDFVRSVFRMDFEEMTRAWAHVQYDWLPGRDAVPKSVGQRVAPDHLRSLDFGATLKKVYLAAQTLAVGLEQVILDRAIYGGGYLEQFATTENKLAMVLCSLQMALLEKHVEPDADAARQLMSNEYRDMRSSSGRNLRDFIILRDYVNLLEYVQQVFHHFQATSSTS